MNLMEPQTLTLTYLGEKFEIKLLKEIIGKRFLKGKEIYRDSQYGFSILNILEEKHFNLEYSKILLRIIKEYYAKYRSIPFYDTLKELIAINYSNQKDILYQFLSDVDSVIIENVDHIRDSGKTFIQQQNFSAAVKEFEKRLKLGQVKSFEEGVDIIRRAIQVNNINQKATIISSDTFTVVGDETRMPIPSGIGVCFDKRLNGGLSRGDLGIYGAGTKVGKTTFAVSQVSEAFKNGKTVVYCYFEGKEDEEIIGKLQASWSGLTINEAKKIKNKAMVEMECKRFIKNAEDRGGNLIMRKFDSLNTKWADIENFLYNLEKIDGYKIDMVLIDYLELVQPTKQYGENNWHQAAPDILREIENVIAKDKLNCACWVFIQGTKNTNGISDLDLLMMGGSAKIAQIAHVIILVGKSFEQGANGTANLNIIGSRIGDAPVRFKDIKYDNARVKIYVEDENIVTDFQKPKRKVKEDFM